MLLGILLAAVIVVCIALVGVILLQRSEGGVLGMSGGGPGNFMSARGTGDLLTTTTQILAGVFFALCLIMTLVTGHIRRENALASSLKNLSITPGAPASSAPAQTSAAQTAMAPGAPASGAAPAPVRAPSNDGLNLFGNAPAPGAHAPAQPKSVAVQPPPAQTASTPTVTAKPSLVAKPVVKKPAQTAKPVSSASPEASSAPAATPAPVAPAPTAPASN
jgi:preprotein translocase subunit SecG